MEVPDTGLEFYKAQPKQFRKFLLTPEEIRDIPYYKLTWDGTLPYSILVKQTNKILLLMQDEKIAKAVWGE